MDFRTFLVLLLINILRASAPVEVEYDSDPIVYWENFKKTFQKSYSPEEEPLRRANFEANLKQIDDHNLKYNQGLHSFSLGLNEWADMLHEEFQETVNGLQLDETNDANTFEFSLTDSVPDSVDWREYGAVSPVENQGKCGSCYSFAATGALEGQNKIKNGELVPLSKQNIIDCAFGKGTNGCHGGVVQKAFVYVKDNNGIDSEDSYPYTARLGKCMYNEDNKASICKNYYNVSPRTEDGLKQAVGQIGPISVAIDASRQSFQHYSGGIYDEPECKRRVNHGVLVVGYGSEDGKDYWIVKNSWGTNWGEGGFARMVRNKNNQCQIASYGSYPEV